MTKPIFESLESRILLSATPTSDSAVDNFDHVVTADQQEALTLQDTVTEVLFIDSGVEDYNKILQNFHKNVEVFIIPADQDGINFIDAVLSSRANLTAVHILSHGAAGQIALGNTVLTQDNLADYHDSLQSWSTALTADADLLIYGCNFGQSYDMLQQLAALTEADIAASDDLTGAARLGGDADLEVHVGTVETAAAFTQQQFDAAELVFDQPTVPGATAGRLTVVTPDVQDEDGIKVGDYFGNDTYFADPDGDLFAGIAVRPQDLTDSGWQFSVAVDEFDAPVWHSISDYADRLGGTALRMLFDTEARIRYNAAPGFSGFIGPDQELRFNVVDASYVTRGGTFTRQLDRGLTTVFVHITRGRLDGVRGSISESYTRLRTVVAADGTNSVSENGLLENQSLPANDLSRFNYEIGPYTGLGTLTVNDDGTYSFDPGTDFDDLAAGATREVEFTYRGVSVDVVGRYTNMATVTITVTGTNDAPDISVAPGATDSAAEELEATDTALTASGTLTVTELDAGDSVTFDRDSLSLTKSGTTTGPIPDDETLKNMLTITIPDDATSSRVLAWEFNGAEAFNYLVSNEKLTLTYNITVTDSSAATASHDIVITINGNDAPTISVVPDTTDSDSEGLDETDATLTASGTLTLTDADAGDTLSLDSKTVVASGVTAGLLLDNEALNNMLNIVIDFAEEATSGTLTWSFDSVGFAFDYLKADEELTLTYTIVVKDSSSLTASQDIVITITGVDDLAVALDDTVTISRGAILSAGVPTVTDPDNPFMTYTYELVNAPDSGTLDFAVDGTYTFDPGTGFDGLFAGQSAIVTFTYRAISDDDFVTDSATVTITITGVGQPPLLRDDLALGLQVAPDFQQEPTAAPINTVPLSLEPLKTTSLDTAFTSSSLQFERRPLAQDPLETVAPLFTGSVDVDSEIAAPSPLELQGGNFYDQTQLSADEFRFIEQLLLEAAEQDQDAAADELSFESSAMSLLEISSTGQTALPGLAQQDLDNRVNLEDTLVDEFDCFQLV